MTRRNALLLAALVAIVLVVAVVVVHAVIGGGRTFNSVASMLKEQAYIVSQVGSPASITKNDGPWRVSVAPDGRRHGFYSITAKGTKGEQSLKAYWQELSGGSVEIYAIYRTKAWAQDELVWGAPRQGLN